MFDYKYCEVLFMLEFLTMVAQHFGVSGNMSEYGGKVTLSGLLIVFGMLVLLVFVILVFGLIMKKFLGLKKQKPIKKVDVTNTSISAEVFSDNDEIIAAISAAVMMMYEGTGKTPVIRSIKPSVKGYRTPWKAAGVANNTRAF